MTTRTTCDRLRPAAWWFAGFLACLGATLWLGAPLVEPPGRQAGPPVCAGQPADDVPATGEPPALLEESAESVGAGLDPQHQRFGWVSTVAAQEIAAGRAAAETHPLFGWAGEAEAKAARAVLAEQLPELSYTAAEAPNTKDRTVGLWHLAKLVNAGKHLPTNRQEIGDCVSHGTSNAIEYSLTAYLVRTGKYRRWRENYPPYIYGVSRVIIGKGRLGRGDGSVGAWAAAGVQQYGVLAVDFDGVPAYSGSVAKKWGVSPGVPQRFLDEGKKHLVEARLVTTFDAACEAISCGNAIAVCSMQGFNRIVERNGRIEGIPSGTWPHCMAFVGYDTRKGREALYCLNSWGPNAHAAADRYAALDNAPPGGFWVDARTAERMLSGRDSYAYSFDGFEPAVIFPLLQEPDAVPGRYEPSNN